MTVKIYAQKDPSQIPWGAHDVDVVLNAQVSSPIKQKQNYILLPAQNA